MTRKELEHVIFVLSSAKSMTTNDPVLESRSAGGIGIVSR
jgi:hypothetical protein